MKDKFKLIGITVLFVLTGLVLSYFTLQDSLDYCVVDNIEYKVGEELQDYQGGYNCFCGEDSLVECTPVEFEKVEPEEDFSFDTSDLETEGLEFDYTYLTGFFNEEQILNVTPVKFTNISVSDGNLILVLEQMQLCPEPNVASNQVGFYEKFEEKLNLYHMIKPAAGAETLSCTVQLKYVFEDFGSLENMEISFIDNDGVTNDAMMCVYNENIYSDNDVFRNSEGEFCTCLNGRIECEQLSD